MLIQEKVKPLQPFRVDNGNIHGHVCIDLHNTKSGSTERILGDNLVTNAAQDILNLAAIGFTTPPYNLLPLATNLLGGLFIFDGTLQENVNNVEFPGSLAKLIGRAGDRVDTSINTLGIRNNEESKSIQNGYKTVWDFSTNCCNGTIRSLARTSLNNGNYLKDYTNLFGSEEFFDNYQQRNKIFMKDNKIYVNNINKIYKSPLLGESVYNDFNNRLADTFETWDSSNVISNLSGDVTDNIRLGYTADSNSYLHNLNFYTYNISTGLSITHTLPNGITFSTYASGPVKMGDYIYVTSNNNIYKISLNNTSNYSILDYHYSSSYGCLQPMGKAIKGGYNNESYIIYDDDTVIPLDNYNRLFSDRGALTTFHNKPFIFNGSGYTWGSSGHTTFNILINEFLGTIFNLPEAITKTANQTMKITYTLTNV